MANTVEYIYEVLDRFSGPLGKLDKLTRKNQESLKKFSQSSIGAGKTLSASLTAPIVGLGAASAYAFGQFEAAMGNISTLIDTNVESMADMQNAVLEISKRTPVAISDLTAALYTIRSAGVSAADAMSVLENSARLGVAGLGTTEEAVALATGAINAFKLEGQDQQRVYDVIFKAVKNGATTIAGLAQGFGGVAAQVAGAGVQVDDYLASISAMTTVGNLPAAQAHTQMRAAIVGLQRPSKDLSRIYKKLGSKDLKELIEKSGGIVPAFEAINDVLGGSKEKMMQLIGSSEGVAAISSLLDPASAAYKKAFDEMRTGANAVDDAFEKQRATFNASMTSMSNSIGRVGIKIGAVLLPYIQIATRAIERFGSWFENLSPKMQKIIVLVAALAAGVGPLLIGLGLVAGALAAISLPVIAIVGGFALLGAGIAALVIYWDEFTSAVNTAYQAILPVIDAIIWILKNSPVGLLAGGVMKVAGMFGGGENPPTTPSQAENTAERKERQGSLDVNGGISVTATPGTKVENSNINLNGGSNVATAW